MRLYLVDRITHLETNRAIRGTKQVTQTEDMFEHHFPEKPVMPGIMLLEAMVQLAGWLEAASSDFSRWLLLARVTKCNFSKMVLPGDTVHISVEKQTTEQDGLSNFLGSGMVNKTRCFAGQFTGICVPADDLFEIERLRRRYLQLSA